jgi:predicted dehydrogenase
MALYLTPDRREAGKANFERAVGEHGLTRRDFMKGMVAAAAAGVPISAAVYFNYAKPPGNPVKVGLIGAGDEGGVLASDHNPEYLQIVAVADFRPYNKKRIFEGEGSTSRRRGLKYHYGNNAANDIKVYDDYKELLQRKDIEGVIIAVPLHLHAPVAIDAMNAGKHVLCEKLMAWNISQCKDMIHTADSQDRVLAIGHQRHYSLLYAHAAELMKAGELGDVKHIRALWHRNNSWPRLDDNGKPVLDHGQPMLRDSWHPPIPNEDRDALEARITSLGYKSMEELVRWRLYNRTGQGLMAELGSHQLDACSIFLGKVHPLAVSGVGGKFFYHDDRENDDHVFVTFEFPGKNYANDKNDIVVVTYSSINTNQFENYGECVMGSHGTMIVEKEQNIFLFPERNPNAKTEAGKGTSLAVSTASAAKPSVDSSASGPPDPAKAQAKGADALGSGPISFGYREEMEHWAYCIRMWNEAGSKDQRPKPRCEGRVAMADAIIALTANQAMHHRQRIEFDPKWFDAATDAVPDKDMVVHAPTV